MLSPYESSALNTGTILECDKHFDGGNNNYVVKWNSIDVIKILAYKHTTWMTVACENGISID